jgi:hypothetical protein
MEEEQEFARRGGAQEIYAMCGACVLSVCFSCLWCIFVLPSVFGWCLCLSVYLCRCVCVCVAVFVAVSVCVVRCFR